MDKVQRKNITSLRHSLSQYRKVAELRTWQWYYIPTKAPTALSLSLYTKFIYSEWGKKAGGPEVTQQVGATDVSEQPAVNIFKRLNV
jgi:hypothetical protein